MPRGRPILLYLPETEALAKRTHALLGKAWQLIPFQVIHFPDGEVKTVLPKGNEYSVSGSDAFVLQARMIKSIQSPQDHFMELAMAIETLTGCRAKYRTVVTPWFAYAAQDKRRRREPLTGKLAARILQIAGATGVICVDPHNDTLENAFDAEKCNFLGVYALSPLLRELDQRFNFTQNIDRFAASAVDEGRGDLIKHISKHRHLMPVLPTKVRDYETGQVKQVIIAEDVTNRTVIIFDDMIRTAGSVIETAMALISRGAIKVIVIATHPNFCNQCPENLNQICQATKPQITEVLVTDSFTFPPGYQDKYPWLIQVTLADLLAEAISSIHQEQGVSHVYRDDDH